MCVWPLRVSRLWYRDDLHLRAKFPGACEAQERFCPAVLDLHVDLCDSRLSWGHVRPPEAVSSARPGRPERRKTRKTVTPAPSRLSWLTSLKSVRTKIELGHFQFEQENTREVRQNCFGSVCSRTGAGVLQIPRRGRRLHVPLHGGKPQRQRLGGPGAQKEG